MKYWFFILIIIGFSNTALAQSSENPVFTGEQPILPGGNDAKKTFISSNIRYPEEAKKNQIQGTVELKFIVETDGSLSNIQIVSDPGGGLGEEALRIYEMMPNWIPGRLNGNTVRIPVNETLTFRLKKQPVKK